MKWHRVEAIIVRHIYNFRHSWDRVTDAFYWPTMDILLWGLTSQFILANSKTIPNIVVVLLTGLIYWQIVWRSQYEITTNLLEELWSANILNLFTSPLMIAEWILGIMMLGIVKLVATLGFASLLAFVLYAVNVYATGFWFLPFLALLVMTGWSVGLIVSALIIQHGSQIQTLAWAGVYVLAPFSGIYYPIAVLPQWAQTVAHFLPTSYVFEGMRKLLTTGSIATYDLLFAFMLNVVYLGLGIACFLYSFNKRKQKGLAQLH